MSKAPALTALNGLRIGPVSYLNTKPLIYGLDPQMLQAAVPAELAEKFTAGELDAALLPLFEILRAGGGTLVDDVAIACEGEVYSVIVASQTDFGDCEEIHLDPASRSSVALLRVLLAEFYPDGPKIAEGQDIPAAAARLLIGDAAIRFRQKNGDEWQYHDLGQLWEEHTGLPFVFAAWIIARPASKDKKVCEAFRTLKKNGLAARETIAQGETDPAFALKYLTDYIRYDLGAEEKRAIRLFETLARQHNVLPMADLARLDFR